MKSEWKTALAGGCAGALVALVVVFAAGALGLLPGRAGDAALHDYLMAHPEILVDMQTKLQAEQDAATQETQQDAVDKLGTKAFFDPRFAYITGPANAKRTVVEFFDYNCPYCRASIPALKAFYARHKNDTRFAFIEFPIKGPQSTLAARAALAARRQGDKYVAFHFALMAEDGPVDSNTLMVDAKKSGLDWNKLQNDMNAPDIAFAIAAAHGLAEAAKIDGTPAFIINGKIREGAINDGILNQMARG
ncbi:MAG: DsbA family protein [Rhizomicrobium sp.]